MYTDAHGAAHIDLFTILGSRAHKYRRIEPSITTQHAPASSTAASSPLAVITRQSFSVGGSKVNSPKHVHWKPKTKVTTSRRATAMCPVVDGSQSTGEQNSLGATWQEIVQIPSRTLTAKDNLCSHSNSNTSSIMENIWLLG